MGFVGATRRRSTHSMIMAAESATAGSNIDDDELKFPTEEGANDVENSRSSSNDGLVPCTQIPLD